MPITRSKRPARKSTPLPRAVKPEASAASKASGSTRTSSRRAAQPSAQRGAILGNISPERKVDIIGVIMVFVGLLTLLGLFSANRSGLTGSWARLLALGFGWGVYLLPAGLIILGAWLVARNVERLPELNIERIVGILLLFSGLLVAFHSLTGSTDSAMDRAAQGGGGGYLGALLQRLLVPNIGGLGTAVLVFGWLLVGLAMTLDLSMQEMFRWVGPLWRRLKERLGKPLPKPASAGLAPAALPGPAEGPGSFGDAPPDDFRPLPPQSGAHRPAAGPIPGVAVRTGLPGTPQIPWFLPKPTDILEAAQAQAVNEEYIEKRARLIEETLASFGAPSQVVEISRGPTVTMFGVEPLFVETRNGRTRVRVSKIVSLADDLALALAAPRIRIQAPVPGRGFVGIEVPNEEMTLVTLREVVESEVFGRIHSPLRLALGKDVAGHPKVTNLEAMPHLLIAGTTGSGKSVCVNAILSCLLLNNTPDDLRLILVDPKRVELTGYNGIPHLLAPVVVEIERVVGALQWMTREMDKRYHTLCRVGGAQHPGLQHAHVRPGQAGSCPIWWW